MTDATAAGASTGFRRPAQAALAPLVRSGEKGALRRRQVSSDGACSKPVRSRRADVRTGMGTSKADKFNRFALSYVDHRGGVEIGSLTGGRREKLELRVRLGRGLRQFNMSGSF